MTAPKCVIPGCESPAIHEDYLFCVICAGLVIQAVVQATTNEYEP